MRIELLWFEGCPNHERAETMLREVMGRTGSLRGLHAPLCRLYLTGDGLRGLPERRWIADALAAAAG